MKKILIIKLSALGDVFITLPHIEAICKHHADDEIWIMTSPPFKLIFENHPKLKLVLIDRKKNLKSESPWPRVLWVRHQHFDVIYDFQGNRISRNLVRFSKSPIKAGTQPVNIYNRHPQNFYTNKSLVNIFDVLNETLTSAEVPKADKNCVIYPSKKDFDKINNWKQKNNIENKNYVLMHAGCSFDWISRRWHKDNFLKTAQLLAKDHNLKIIWVGTNEDKNINLYLSSNIGINATNEFNVMELYLLAKDAKLALANDSGPMHIMAASGIPVYSFFGSTNWVRSHALGQKDRVFQKNLDCSPCYKKQCPPKYAHACLAEIKPEEVYLKIKNDGIL